MVRIAALAATLLGVFPAFAQDAQEPIPFAGGKLTITENADGEKVLAFDGKELSRNYVVYFDRTADVADMTVALFEVGDGGNACGPASLIVWKEPEGEVKSQAVGENDCGAPLPALTTDAIYYVPYLLPGASAPVQRWTPSEGLKISGNLTYAPQPGTDWGQLDATKVGHIIDTFQNEALYKAASAMLGDRLTDVVTGLSVGGGAEILPSGIFWSSGGVPHAWGVSDPLTGVDARGQKLYCAQQTKNGPPQAWPALAGWPADVKAAMTGSIAGQQ